MKVIINTSALRKKPLSRTVWKIQDLIHLTGWTDWAVVQQLLLEQVTTEWGSTPDLDDMTVEQKEELNVKLTALVIRLAEKWWPNDGEAKSRS